VKVVVAEVPSASVATIDFWPGCPDRCLLGIVALHENDPSVATVAEQSTVLTRLGRFRPDMYVTVTVCPDENPDPMRVTAVWRRPDEGVMERVGAGVPLVTVSRPVPAIWVEGSVAVIPVIPVARPVARPPVEIDDVVGLDDAHVTLEVRSSVLRSE